MLKWTSLHPQFNCVTMLGLIPLIIFDTDPRPAAEQIAQRYVGGWHPTGGFSMNEKRELVYPGDPPMRPLAEAKLRDETLIFYEAEWMAIIQPHGHFSVARMD